MIELLISALPPALPQHDARFASVPWSDANLEVRDGLVLWLDAAAQAAAFGSHGRAAPAEGAELGVWYDGSGRGHDVVQRERAAQPRFEGSIVRFDGVDDVLAATGLRAQLAEFTLFVRARANSNPGGFRGFVAGNATGRNDYQSGFTVDLSWAPTARLETLNVEGAGFGGARDLLDDVVDFGTFHTFTVCATAGSVTLHVDGKEQGRRERDATPLRIDELCVGARFYSNTSDVPCATGFLDGEIAEVLLYERCLAADERASVERRLASKWSALEPASSAGLRRVPLVAVTPKPVEFMAPGFTARRLPVDLTNVNNVRWRSDGKLIALGYDGNVWRLDDRDGDGLAESVHSFFENRGSLVAPIGMALTPPGYRLGRGVFVACKGKVVLLADQDGDDVAEKEIVVASGWAPGAIQHDVDALGVALAPDGRLFFGLGTSDYTNAYLRDGNGVAHYDLASERGAILEVAPDFSSRRIHCTGIRFPVALAFDGDGELFATDQEGATWLANGNPFDELLQIQKGRHYGFPPRHPAALPDVIDEPSLFDYGPQHQSICGLCFNESPGFGPPSFQVNALVAGYSRGTLLRTELARSRAGLVARSHLVARFDQLACDLCTVPGGGLIVATHGGAPDWGSGPKGRGTLWRLDWRFRGSSGKEEPQPLFAFAAAPDEVRVAFDRPLEARRWEQVTDRLRITFGEAVSPADHLELHRPGYAVVARQLAAPRFDLAVRSIRLLDEQRTLSLRTEPHARSSPHAMQLTARDGEGRFVDWHLGYDLAGVAAEWTAREGGESWSGWLPHLDLAVARAFTAGSRDHDRLWASLLHPGTLTLRCALDLDGMLRPRVQPGASVDAVLPDEEVTIELTSGSRLVERRTLKPRRGELEPLEVAIETGGGPLALDVAWRTAEDARARPLELRRIVLPWAARLGKGASSAADAEAAIAALPAELAGGNWSRGRAVFFGEDAMCSRCHTLRDGSATFARKRIGPDLSQVWQRDLASLRRDVLSPSAAIHPDHLPHALKLKDGSELVGVVRSERGPDGAMRTVVGEAGGKESVIAEKDVVSRRALDVSIMPSGLHNVLSAQQVTDLFTYLLTPPLLPAPITIPGAPPLRTAAEIETLMVERAVAARVAAAAIAPLRVVLVAGPKDHGPDEHDYPDWQRRWSRLLALADGIAVETAEGWPSAAQWRSADVVVHYSANPAWSAADPAREQELDAFLARGGGLVLLHYAVNGRDAVAQYAQRVGLAWRDGASRFRHGAIDLELAPAARDHEITRPLAAALRSSGAKLRFEDETYWNLEGDAASITVLATSQEEGRAQPQLWTREAGGGRVFVSLLGHYRWTFDDPLFRLLVLRAIAWCARQPGERLAGLATVGARLAAE